jgi:hypothetical protein
MDRTMDRPSTVDSRTLRPRVFSAAPATAKACPSRIAERAGYANVESLLHSAGAPPCDSGWHPLPEPRR